MLAGARSPSTAFVISVLAPMTTPDAQMNFAVANLLSVEGYSRRDVDPWVPVSLSVERLAATSAGRPNVETVVIAGADHAMMLSVDAKTQMDPAFFPRQAPEAPAYFALLGAWLARRGLAERR